MTTYKIRRFYLDNEDRNGEIVATGLSLEEAQAHCNDPETSSGTCSTTEGLARTRNYGPWFDGYDEEKVSDIHLADGEMRSRSYH